jgi:hypothetical protein
VLYKSPSQSNQVDKINHHNGREKSIPNRDETYKNSESYSERVRPMQMAEESIKTETLLWLLLHTHAVYD